MGEQGWAQANRGLGLGADPAGPGPVGAFTPTGLSSGKLGVRVGAGAMVLTGDSTVAVAVAGAGAVVEAAVETAIACPGSMPTTVLNFSRKSTSHLRPLTSVEVSRYDAHKEFVCIEKDPWKTGCICHVSLPADRTGLAPMPASGERASPLCPNTPSSASRAARPRGASCGR